jgi:hypothetical protein
MAYQRAASSAAMVDELHSELLEILGSARWVRVDYWWLRPQLWHYSGYRYMQKGGGHVGMCMLRWVAAQAHTVTY